MARQFVEEIDAADDPDAPAGAVKSILAYDLDARTFSQKYLDADDAAIFSMSGIITDDAMAEIEGKHLPGRHNQLNHGYRRAGSLGDRLAGFAREGKLKPGLHGVDKQLVDYVQGRSLSDPRAIARIDTAVGRREWTTYSKTPFFEELLRRQGLDPADVDQLDPWAHDYSRRALFNAQPQEDVPLDSLIFTQPHVNRAKVLAKIEARTGGYRSQRGGGYVVRHKGKHYMMDGHHGAMVDALTGAETTRAFVLDLDKPAGPTKPYTAGNVHVSGRGDSWRVDVAGEPVQTFTSQAEAEAEAERLRKGATA